MRKFNCINAGTSASPQSSIPNTCWGYKFCIFAVPFLGPKNGPIFGAASYNSNKDGPIWRPQNWDPEIVNNLQKLLIFWSRGLFLVGPNPCVLLAFEVSIFGPFWGQLWRMMVSRAFSSLPALTRSIPKRQTLRLPMISLSASVLLPGLSGNRGVRS